jgi:hypothetical protein
LTGPGRRRARAMRRDLLDAARELLEPIPAHRRDGVADALEEVRLVLPTDPARPSAVPPRRVAGRGANAESSRVGSVLGASISRPPTTTRD